MSTPVFIDTMMRGNNRIRTVVGQYLEENMSLYIDTLRNQNPELTPAYLPYPKQYLAADPADTSSNTYPIIGTYFTGTDGFNSVNVLDSGSTQYEVVYESVIFVTVTTPFLGLDEANLPMYASPPRAATIKLRDDLTACLRAALLGSPSFKTAGQEDRVLLDISSIRETYPEPMKLNQSGGAQWICSGLITCNVRSNEIAASPVWGSLQNVDLDTDLLPFE